MADKMADKMASQLAGCAWVSCGEGAMTMWNIVVVHERGHVLFLLLPPLGVDGLGDAGAPSVAPGALGSGAGRPVLGVILRLIQAVIGDVDDGQ